MNRRFNQRRRAGQALTLRTALALLSFAALAKTTDLQAASATFLGTAAGVGTTAAFDTDANWNPAMAPGTTTTPATAFNTDIATFNAGTGTAASPSAITFGAARSLGGFSFVSPSGVYTIGVATGPILYLTSGGSITNTNNLLFFAEPIVLSNASAAATSGTYTIDGSGSSNSRPTNFSSSIAGSATAGGTTTLILTGSYVGGVTGGNPNATTGAITNGMGGGTLALAKSGSNVWQLGGTSNTYSGGTTVNAGVLSINGATTTSQAVGAGAVTLAGGTLALGSSGSMTMNNNLVVSGTASITSRNAAATLAPSTVTGAGTLNLSYAFNTTVTQVNVTYGFNSTVGATNYVGTLGAFAGTLNVAQPGSTAFTTTLNLTNANVLTNTSGTVAVNPSGILTSSVANANSGSAVSVAGGTVTLNGNTGVGMLTLTNNKTFGMTSGTLYLTLPSLAAGAAAAAGTFDQIVGGGTSTFTLSGGTLDLGGVTAAAGANYQVFSTFASGNVSGISFTDYVAGDGSMPSLSNTGLLSFAAVPEPAAWAQMACLGSVGAVFLMLRRRKAAR